MRDIDSNSVCPPVCHVPMFCGNGLNYCNSLFTTRQPNHALDVLCAQVMLDLFAIVRFHRRHWHNRDNNLGRSAGLLVENSASLNCYLSCRCQTVCMDSDWLYITAGMPQGSPLGLLSFLLLIDDLTVECLTHKYVDDTNLTESCLVVHSKLTCRHSFSSCRPGPPQTNEDKHFMKTKALLQNVPLNT